MQIAIVAFDDFTDLDLVLHWDILNRVRVIAGIQDWHVKIIGTKPTHTSSLGLPIPTSGRIGEVVEADGVILCSGKGTRSLLKDQEYLSRLRLNPSKQYIGAQCSGSLILGALGLLNGVRVTAYPPVINELQSYGAKLVSESLVVHDKIATASSCLAGQYLSQWMIESLADADIARTVMTTVAPL